MAAAIPPRLLLLLSVAVVSGWHAQAPLPARSSSRPTVRAPSPAMMPIGVPKVAYKVPGAQFADWVDLYNRLYREVHDGCARSSVTHAGRRRVP